MTGTKILLIWSYSVGGLLISLGNFSIFIYQQIDVRNVKTKSDSKSGWQTSSLNDKLENLKKY